MADQFLQMKKKATAVRAYVITMCALQSDEERQRGASSLRRSSGRLTPAIDR